MKEEFLSDINKQITRSRTWQFRYKITYLVLTVLITASGFMTAASTNESLSQLPIFSSPFVLLYGLCSAISAILIQILKPQEKHLYHRTNKHKLVNIRNAVKFNDLDIADAQKLRAELNQNID